MSECFKLKRREEPKAVALTLPMSRCSVLPVEVNTADAHVFDRKPVISSVCSKPVDEVFRPYSAGGVVRVAGSSPNPVCIMRDTGCAQSLLIRGAAPVSVHSFTGKYVPLRCIGGYRYRAPLHCVDLECDWITGPVVVGVVSELPMNGVQFLLRNDLVDVDVDVRPKMVKEPSHDQELKLLSPDLSTPVPSYDVSEAKTCVKDQSSTNLSGIDKAVQVSVE